MATGAWLAWTVVVAVALSFALAGSKVELETVAVFEIVEPRLAEGETCTTIVTVAEAPVARLPRLQEIVVVPEQLPCEAVVETSVVPEGIVSETVTPWAVLPVELVLWFVTVMA